MVIQQWCGNTTVVWKHFGDVATLQWCGNTTVMW